MNLPYTLDPSALPPIKAHADDAGYDLHATHGGIIAPGDRYKVHTGIHLALPSGTVGMICPRSGLAAKHGVSVLNAPGIIDAGYRGEVCVILVNHSGTPFEFHAGDRIAQLLVMKLPTVTLDQWAEFPDTTSRGVDGFGSTGVKAVA